MTHFTSVLTGLLIAAAVSGAAAQDRNTPTSPSAPRVELGVGAAWFVNGANGGTTPLGDARVSFAFSRSWAIEGGLAFRPARSGFDGLYRIQAKWRLPIGTDTLRPHLTFGGAGFISRWSHPAGSYYDARSGEAYTWAARSGWSVDPPIYLTVGVGVQQRLGKRVALRADLAAGFGISDYGVGCSLLPSVSVSIPLGPYPASSVR
jgi:hypothetical protein